MLVSNIKMLIFIGKLMSIQSKLITVTLTFSHVTVFVCVWALQC